MSAKVTPSKFMRLLTSERVATSFVVLVYLLAWWFVTDRQVGIKSSHGHYQSLTEGFIRGQTSLVLEPDPRLATLENPWAGNQGIPRVHDATYFKGKYYLYFGATPVLLAYLPFRLVTALSLNNHAATLFFLTVGFVGFCSAWRWVARSLGYRSGHWMTLLGILSIGLGSFTTILLGSDTFYSVPLASAYACSALMLCFSIHACSPSSQRRLLGLAAASASAGLLVGSRPNWVFVASLVLLPTVVVSLRQAHLRARISALIAGLAPVTASGLALACYNYVRFGNPLEFGVRYQFASVDQRFIRLWDPALWPTHFVGYLLEGPSYGFYFPFVRNVGAIGLLPWAPGAILGLIGFLCLGASLLPRLRAWRAALVVCGTTSLAGVINLVSLSGVAFQNDRYSLDFIPLLVFSSLVALGLLGKWLAECRRLWRILFVGIPTALVVATLVQSAFLGMRFMSLEQRMPRVARAINWPFAVVENMLGAEYGPLRMNITFPKGTAGRQEPLVVSADGKDCVFVRYVSEELAEIRFFHLGVDGPASQQFVLNPGQSRDLFVDLGGLYPDENHPFFTFWPQTEVERVKRRVHIALDGNVLIDREAFFYPSDHKQVFVGTTPQAFATSERFSGAIESVSRQGVPKSAPPAAPKVSPGWFRLRLKVPEKKHEITEPLLSFGTAEEGALLFLRYVDPGFIRLGYSVKSYGVYESRPLPYEPLKPVQIDFGMGASATAFPKELSRTDLVIRFNGTTVLLDRAYTWPFDGRSVAVGINSVLFGHSDQVFSGPEISLERIEPEALNLLSVKGSIRMHVAFSRSGIGRGEPLVVVGGTGEANSLGVHLVDDKELQFTLDRWGVALSKSPRISYSIDKTHRLDIEAGMLYPSDDSSEEADALRSTLRLTLDGVKVWEETVDFNSTSTHEVTFGANRIGLSTVASDFSGEIKAVEALRRPDDQ
ncbi:MAG: hypothetical protein SFV32_10790 [Opitutaceae bacterium]|nr:hypothetical protein [Opitutaceae bacterium]